MHYSKDLKAYLMLILCTAFWSGNFIVGKVATLFEIPPLTLNFYRWFVAWIILAPFTLQEVMKNWKIIKENIFSLTIMAFTSISVFNSVVYYALNYTQVLNGVLMISTIPVLIIFISSIFKTEKTNLFQVLGVAISLSGVLIIITKMQFQNLINLELNKGDLWMLVAMLSWAIYSIMMKEKKINLKPFILLQTLISIGVIFLIPMYFFEVLNGQYLNFNIPTIFTISYVVLFAGIGAYIFWNGAVLLIGPNRSGIFLHLMPVFSALMAIFILGENFSNYHFFGAVLIVCGIILSSKKKYN